MDVRHRKVLRLNARLVKSKGNLDNLRPHMIKKGEKRAKGIHRAVSAVGLRAAIRRHTKNGDMLARFMIGVMLGKMLRDSRGTARPSIAQRVFACSWLADRGFGLPATMTEVEAFERGVDPKVFKNGGVHVPLAIPDGRATHVDARSVTLVGKNIEDALRELKPDDRKVAMQLLDLTRPALRPSTIDDDGSPIEPDEDDAL